MGALALLRQKALARMGVGKMTLVGSWRNLTFQLWIRQLQWRWSSTVGQTQSRGVMAERIAEYLIRNANWTWSLIFNAESIPRHPLIKALMGSAIAMDSHEQLKTALLENRVA